MRRWLPFPLVAAALLAAWLLLNQTATPGALLLGCVLAVVGVLALGLLDMPRMVVRRLFLALRLALNVLLEIVRSNNAVARIVLRRTTRGRRSGFVRIPLETRNPYCLTVLACIITATPGTLWVDYDSKDNAMLLHVLDLIDEAAWVEIIKTRYEKPLMEIFG